MRSSVHGLCSLGPIVVFALLFPGGALAGGGGGCGDPAAGSCFESTGSPFCADLVCCETVCAADPFCCDTTWDDICAGEALEMCPPNDDCDARQEIFNGVTPFTTLNATTDGPEPCGSLGSDVWFNYTADFAGQITISTCGSDFDTVLAAYDDCDCATDCCESNGTPGCDDAECQELICSMDPFCCDTIWDMLCAADAAKLCTVCTMPTGPSLPPPLACNDDGPCDGPPVAGGGSFQSQIAIDVLPGRCYKIQVGGFAGAQGTGLITITKGQSNDDCADRLPIVAGTTPFSNTFATSQGGPLCAPVDADVWFNYVPEFTGAVRISTCGSSFDTVLAVYDTCDCVTSDCCEANGTPGCSDPECQDLVCGVDSFCCDVEWDGICAGVAVDLCGICQLDLPDPIACNDNAPCPVPPVADGGGASAVESEVFITVEAGLCYKIRVGGFEGAQGDGIVTITEFPGCGFPGAGSCYSDNGTPGCDDPDCCKLVCDVDPFCCDVEWDQFCAWEAGTVCRGCGSNAAGSCLEDNGTPSCSDLNCCNTVCDIDPFCCDTAWDGICADEAADFCCAGDIVPDGEVNVDDLVTVILTWGPCGEFPSPCPADLDANRVVDVDDLVMVILGWGPCGGDG